MSGSREDERYEEIEGELDPHRREERAQVTSAIAARLTGRGVTLTGTESSEQVASMLEAVERFERAVEAHGGDLMVDSGRAREPDDPSFVLPKRQPRESVAAYLGRLDQATERLRSARGKKG
ncbi:MAG TPA: hypothetical protein VEI06_07410 [Gemmatimonadaceae bacterium]|nr:hypothetical protein [Gemmatimonadaceae bacterium]